MSDAPFAPGEVPQNKEFTTYTFDLTCDCPHQAQVTRSVKDLSPGMGKDNAVMGAIMQHGMGLDDKGNPIADAKPCEVAMDPKKWTAVLKDTKSADN